MRTIVRATRWALLFVSLACVSTALAQAPPCLRTWSGAGEQSLNFPLGIALDAAGDVYVADCSNNRVEVFTSDGTFVTAWGSQGSAAGQFLEPGALAIGPDGNVYVADYGNSRVQVFTPAGQFLRQWGGYGTADGQMKYPNAIAVGTTGNVYVAEGGRIQQFTSGGAFLRKWTGNGHAAFGSTTGIAVDALGSFFVTRYPGVDGAVWAFSTAGTFVTGWGIAGTGDGQFTNYPGQVAIDASGLVYVADSNNNRVQVFRPTGELVLKWGDLGSGPGQMYYPSAIAFDAAGAIYITDTMNNRIEAFGPLQRTVPVRGSTWGALKVRFH